MSKKEIRAYSRYTDEAIRLLGKHIKSVRLERGITTQELAERAGVSRGLLRRIENGDSACGIGVVFETAHLLGLQFFNSDYNDLVHKNKIIDDKLTLLPSRIKKKKMDIDDDF